MRRLKRHRFADALHYTARQRWKYTVSVTSASAPPRMPILSLWKKEERKERGRRGEGEGKERKKTRRKREEARARAAPGMQLDCTDGNNNI